MEKREGEYEHGKRKRRAEMEKILGTERERDGEEEG